MIYRKLRNRLDVVVYPPEFFNSGEIGDHLLLSSPPLFFSMYKNFNLTAYSVAS
jgi:hypothetical protein